MSYPAKTTEREDAMQENIRHADGPGWPQSYEARREKVRRFNLTSDIFFGKVMEEIPACQEFIRIITKENLKIKNVQTQYSIRNVENHSVILDVLAEDESGKLVNVEIHLKEDEDHVKRVRFHLGSIDVSFLEKGNPFENLPEVYLIYITEKDFIGGNQGIYHVDRILRECGTELCNGVHEIYVNLQAETGDRVQQELIQYMGHSDRAHETGTFPDLAARVNLLKEKREGVEIMCEILEQERAEGREEGREEGLELAQNVLLLLNQDVPVEEIARRLNVSAEVVRSLSGYQLRKI